MSKAMMMVNLRAPNPRKVLPLMRLCHKLSLLHLESMLRNVQTARSGTHRPGATEIAPPSANRGDARPSINPHHELISTRIWRACRTMTRSSGLIRVPLRLSVSYNGTNEARYRTAATIIVMTTDGGAVASAGDVSASAPS